MNHPLVRNIRKTQCDVYCGRGSDFGNQWSHLRQSKAKHLVATREESIERHKEWFVHEYETNIVFRNKVDALRGKTLGCYCAPLSCHCNIIAEYANRVTND